MNFEIITDNYQLFLDGAWTTLWLVAASLFLGLIVAVIAALMVVSPNPFIRWPAALYSYIFRGTPMLIQLYIFYYGFGYFFGQIEGIKDTIWWSLIAHAWPWAIITMTLNTGAYTCEILRGAIKNTASGELEAAKSMGFSYMQMMFRIVLPGAFRRALPAYGNEVIYMLHGSAIVSFVTILDLTGIARKLRDEYYDPYTSFIAVAILYLLITTIIVFIFKLVEKRYLAYIRR